MCHFSIRITWWFRRLGSAGWYCVTKSGEVSFVRRFPVCIALEIYETVYGQTSRFVAAGLLVTISKKTTLQPYSKIQLEILTRKLVCLGSLHPFKTHFQQIVLRKKFREKSRYFRFSPNLERRKLRNLPSPRANLGRIPQLGLHNENFMFGLHTVSNGCRFEETPNVEFDG